MRRLVLALAAVVVLAGLAACGDPAPVGSERPAVASSSTAVPNRPAAERTPVTSAAPAAPAPAGGEPPTDVVEFLAVLDDVLGGTPYAGAPLTDPDVFVATGRLLCEELAAGTDADALLAEYIEQLTSGPPELAADHDLMLAGALLGTAVATLCPEQLTVVASD